MPYGQYENTVITDHGDPKPGAQITVYATGTTNLSTIYETETGTAKTNPFYAGNGGYFIFFAANGVYDVKVSMVGSDDSFEYGVSVTTPLPNPTYIPSYASLTAAVTAIGSTPSTLIINESTTITANTTIPVTLSIEVQHPGEIVKTSTYTLAINGSFEAELYQVFSGFNSGDVTFGEGSVNTIHPEWWGGFPDDSTDCASAINSSINSLPNGGTVKFSTGTYKVNSQITTPDDAPIHLMGNGYSSQIKKMFDGDMLSLGALGTIDNIYLEGNGGSYTGRGVVISTGSIDTQNGRGTYRHIFDSWILNTESYGVEFSGAYAGYGSTIRDTRIVPYTNTVPAIKCPSVLPNYSNYVFSNVWSLVNPIADLGTAINVNITGCNGAPPIFTADTTEVAVVGSRLAGYPTNGFTYDGSHNVISGCVINVPIDVGVIFSSTLGKSVWQNNVINSGIPVTDNSAGATRGNIIDVLQTPYYPTWTATVSNPAIGDGTLFGAWERRGEKCFASMTLVIGSTTTLGTGYWQFSVPYLSLVNTVGVVYVLGSAGHFVGTAIIDASTSLVYVAVNSGNFAYVGPTEPFAWAAGNTMRITIEFTIY